MDQSRIDRLTAAERDVLRLMARGHDTKSAAAALGISIHAVNERLRDARRKLEVTSSRAAARALLAAEEEPQENWDRFSGDAPKSGSAAEQPRLTWIVLLVAGALIMSLAAFVATLWSAAVAPLAPQVTAVAPAQGAVIAPGPFTLTVTFDRAMQPGSYSFVRASPETYPECRGAPVQSPDRRSFSLACTARPGRQYEVWFNRTPYLNFRSENGQSARPFRLTFRARN